MRLLAAILVAVAALSGLDRARAAETVAVAAAADLVFCLEELAPAFEKAHSPSKVQVTTGASGNLFAQIQRGAPFHVFMAADVAYPRQLIAAGAAEGDSLRVYAIGHLVLWTKKPGVDVRRRLAVLREPSVRKFAMANPAHAPYGRAAKDALEKAGLWEELQAKLVLGDNVAQTAQFVETGNVDAGIVALSLVRSPKLTGQGTFWEIPEPRMEQGAVLTRAGASNPAAKEFLRFLDSPEARAIFERYGFRQPSP